MTGDWGAVGAAVKARRLQLGLTQKEAAAAAKVSDTTWGSVENARADSYAEVKLLGVCRALGWSSDSVNRLLQGDPAVEVSDVMPSEPGDTVTILEEIGELVDELTRRAREGQL